MLFQHRSHGSQGGLSTCKWDFSPEQNPSPTTPSSLGTSHSSDVTYLCSLLGSRFPASLASFLSQGLCTACPFCLEYVSSTPWNSFLFLRFSCTWDVPFSERTSLGNQLAFITFYQITLLYIFQIFSVSDIISLNIFSFPPFCSVCSSINFCGKKKKKITPNLVAKTSIGWVYSSLAEPGGLGWAGGLWVRKGSVMCLKSGQWFWFREPAGRWLH